MKRNPFWIIEQNGFPEQLEPNFLPFASLGLELIGFLPKSNQKAFFFLVFNLGLLEFNGFF